MRGRPFSYGERYVLEGVRLSNLARITLVHTNDLHSHFDIWPHTATVIRQEVARAEDAGRPVAYVDAGDHLDMSNVVSYGTRGLVNQRLLVLLGCRAMTIGNNELYRLRLHELTGLAARSPFPYFGANMQDLKGQPLPGIQDWIIQNLGPVRVGLFGLTVASPAARALGVDHPDDTETIRRCVAELRAAGAHVIVFLSHLGLDFDRPVAEANLGVDLIIGGHSHSVLPEPEVVKGVYITQAGWAGKYVGVLDLEVDLDARRLTACDGRLVPVDPVAVPADEHTLRVLKEGERDADAALSEVLTTLPVALTHDPLGESRLGPLVAEVLRRRANAEIGMVPGGQALTGLEAGPVTRKQVIEVMQAMFIPALLHFTGAQLQQMLAQSQDPTHYGHKLYAGGMRPRANPIGRIFHSGLAYTVGPDKGILDLRVNGEPVDPDRIYTVGAPSILGFTESGYTAVEGVSIVERFGQAFVREVFEEALRDGIASTLTP